MIHKIPPSLDYLVPKTLNEPTNQDLIKVPQVVKPTKKKMLIKTLGTSLIKSPMSPPSLVNITTKTQTLEWKQLLHSGILQGGRG